MLNATQRNTINKACDGLIQMGIAAGIGYLSSWAFKICQPTHGAVFFAVSTLVYQLTRPFFDSIFAGPGSNEASRFVGVAVSLGAGVGASAFITTALGFPITFNAGLILTCSVIALNIILSCGNTALREITKPVPSRVSSWF